MAIRGAMFGVWSMLVEGWSADKCREAPGDADSDRQGYDKNAAIMRMHECMRH